MNQIAFNITYHAFYSDTELEDFEGIREFRNELSENYISKVKGIPAGRGGGVYELIVDVIVNSTLEDYLKFMLEGLAFDLIKSGTKSLVFKPFLEAFEKFNSKNKNGVAIAEFKLQFEETEIVIKSLDDHGVYSIVPRVFEHLTKMYFNLKHPESGHLPNKISVPVILDPKITQHYLHKFREPLGEEEYLEDLKQEQYFEFWGLEYEFSLPLTQVVYDVKQAKITSDEFYTAAIFEDYVWHDVFGEE
ncbi:MAG: hypothetical protein ACO1O6_11100 [Bacteroidota bacterium]